LMRYSWYYRSKEAVAARAGRLFASGWSPTHAHLAIPIVALSRHMLNDSPAA
jgi:hypothetical protein